MEKLGLPSWYFSLSVLLSQTIMCGRSTANSIRKYFIFKKLLVLIFSLRFSVISCFLHNNNSSFSFFQLFFCLCLKWAVKQHWHNCKNQTSFAIPSSSIDSRLLNENDVKHSRDDVSQHKCVEQTWKWRGNAAEHETR